jgi:titin
VVTYGALATQITLYWQLNSDDETGITVWRRGAGADWTRLATLPAHSTSFTDTGLIPGVPYTYRVRSVGSFGVSVWSNEANATTQSLVPFNPSLGAMSSGPGTISLTWFVYNSPPITGYSLWRKGGGADWAQISVVSENITSYVDMGLMPDTQYTYRIRSFNDSAASLGWSNEVSAWTPIIPPGTPSGLAASVASATQINLTWTLANGSDETAVVVWRKIGTGAFTRLAALPPHTTGYSDTGLTAGTAYTYEVRTVNDFFTSAWSNPATATPS